MTTDLLADNEYELQSNILRGSWSGEKPYQYRMYQATRFLKFPFKFKKSENRRTFMADLSDVIDPLKG